MQLQQDFQLELSHHSRLLIDFVNDICIRNFYSPVPVSGFCPVMLMSLRVRVEFMRVYFYNTFLWNSVVCVPSSCVLAPVSPFWIVIESNRIWWTFSIVGYSTLYIYMGAGESGHRGECCQELYRREEVWVRNIPTAFSLFRARFCSTGELFTLRSLFVIFCFCFCGLCYYSLLLIAFFFLAWLAWLYKNQ